MNAITINVSWGEVEGATEYVVYRSTSLHGRYSRVATTDGLSYEDTGLYARKTYYYMVRARTKVGSVNVYGPYSEKQHI